MVPRNVRNNNPLNIERGADWDGLSPDQTDDRFAIFIQPKYGFRAGYIILVQYSKRGDNTINKIINCWAPPGENNTNNYQDYVASKMGVSADSVIAPNQFVSLMLYMSQMEGATGEYAYPLETAAEGAQLALQRPDIAAYVANYGGATA